MKRAIVLIVLVALAAAGLAGWRQFIRLSVPFQGWAGDEVFVDIAPGLGPSAIGVRLIAAGVVRDAWTWRIALWQSGQATRLKAGEYRFDRPLAPAQAIDAIVRGDVYLRTITFREGLTIAQMARVFEAGGFGAGADFAAAAADASLIADLDPAAPDLEGYVFPDTYAIPRRATARDLVRQAVGRFRAVWRPGLADAAAARGWTPRQAVTLASLIEKETARADERPLVSAVYHNRLRLKMGLQCDPTVIYALERAGRFDGNLRRADLSFNSPYNTYRFAGLPPGPIAAPGRAAIEAALAPADVTYLYFVSRNDGSHAFAASLAEHNRNVHTYQVSYFRGRPDRPAPRSGPRG